MSGLDFLNPNNSIEPKVTIENPREYINILIYFRFWVKEENGQKLKKEYSIVFRDSKDYSDTIDCALKIINDHVINKSIHDRVLLATHECKAEFLEYVPKIRVVRSFGCFIQTDDEIVDCPDLRIESEEETE